MVVILLHVMTFKVSVEEKKKHYQCCVIQGDGHCSSHPQMGISDERAEYVNIYEGYSKI
jgi:hypothetical protein